jgi:tetratricopeptide (TPR) repeat protein
MRIAETLPFLLVISISFSDVCLALPGLKSGDGEPGRVSAADRIAQVTGSPAVDRPAANSRAVQLNDSGVLALARKNYRLAIAKLEEAVKIAPSYKNARENLAIAYNNYGLALQGNPSEAIKQFHKALYMDPQNEATNGNFEAIIGYLKRDPSSNVDRVALGEQAIAASDWYGGVIEFNAALQLKDDAGARRKLAFCQGKLLSYLKAAGLPVNPFWSAQPAAPASSSRTAVSGSGQEGKQPSESELAIEQARDLYDQYVVASDFHNPAIVKFYARDARFSVGGSDPHSLTAKLEIPAEQWKERYLARQKEDSALNRKDRFAGAAYRFDKGAVRVSFTRVDPQVAARVEWLVKLDLDRKWRIFEQTELAIPVPAKKSK